MNSLKFGKIERLWRYPVKSLLGESCQQLSVDWRGVAGDRWYAIRDNRGKFASGKNTRRFCKIKNLFDFQAQYDEAVPLIMFPDSRVVRGNDPSIDRELSNALEQPVTLVEEKQISHFDAESLHIITTASLRWLKSLLPQSIIDERRFRPNLLIDVPGEGLTEHNWRGKRLLIGDELEIEITELTERCIMTTLRQQQLPQDSQIMKTISKNLQHNFGIYAKVVKTGMVQIGDRIMIR